MVKHRPTLPSIEPLAWLKIELCLVLSYLHMIIQMSLIGKGQRVSMREEGKKLAENILTKNN